MDKLKYWDIEIVWSINIPAFKRKEFFFIFLKGRETRTFLKKLFEHLRYVWWMTEIVHSGFLSLRVNLKEWPIFSDLKKWVSWESWPFTLFPKWPISYSSTFIFSFYKYIWSAWEKPFPLPNTQSAVFIWKGMEFFKNHHYLVYVNHFMIYVGLS